jgi:hypothetical protein
MTCSLIEAHLCARPRFGVRPILAPVWPPPAEPDDAAELLWSAIIADGLEDRRRLARAREKLMRLGRESGATFAEFADETVDGIADHLARILSCPREEAVRAVRNDFIAHVSGPLRLERLGLWPTPQQIAESTGFIRT